ncbi:hypothetical protein EDM56_10620 [Brevibacillus fluminis]|uniref:Uncharacterized protein n=1 Tax=Brevibacillus fluminis TaxID=511487 RepID=A0A3M8DQ30_9BACL|nr:hypothetical protein [Brevibacillus fluminis]RNB89629.1 hypothetical protein EDM56_10620 [Brevibacillus fluminis]
MTSFGFRPYVSLIGFCLFIFTMLVNIAFRSTSDPGSKMLLSTIGAIFLVFTLMWGLVGVIEFITLVRKTNKMKTDLKNVLIDREEYRKKSKSLKRCYLVNVSYLVIVSIQLWYVISNWNALNL